MMRALNFLILLILCSCADDNPIDEVRCEECANANLVDTVRNVYLQIKSDRDPVILQEVDSVNNTSLSLLLCDSRLVEKRGETKIIKGSYYLYEACTSQKLPHISLFDYQVLETCFPAIDTTETQVSLYGYWSPYDIAIAGQTYLKPCELPAVFIIEEGELYDVITFRTGGGVANEAIITKDSISLVSSTSTLESLPTVEGEAFRTSYCQAINCSLINYKPTLFYTVKNNFLTIYNENEHATARFYRCKEKQ